jgi:N-acyl-D-amino-acid deacylase
VNVAAYVGHGTIRRLVMRDDFRREATTPEIERMAMFVRDEMRAGALGLSSGLEYDPGIYSEPGEVRTLARVAGSLGGRYISHIRSEDRDFWKAIDEIIRIGRENKMPVQISHMKLAMRSLWGRADSLIGILDRARAEGVDVTADVYPYTYWQSTLTVLFPRRDFENRESANFALSEVSTASGLLLGQFEPDPSYVGKTVADISRLRGTDSVTTLIDLIREANALEARTGRGAESVIGTSMEERDIQKLFAWPHTNICTDGALAGRHPRGFGAFPRFLGRYVRGQRVVPLPEAIRKMTSLAAAHMGIRDRGEIRTGAFADLVLFDSSAVTDRATPTDPNAVSVGIRTVWVNGEPVFQSPSSDAPGETLGRFPGRALRGKAAGADRARMESRIER